jgi:hypothetical protein
MSANFTHSVQQHGCIVRYTFDNRAAQIDYPPDERRAPDDFTSEPLEFKRREDKDTGEVINVAVRGEPTATMQALQAAKAFFLAAEERAAAAEAGKVAAAVAKAKAKAEAASTPKPRGK